MPAELSGPEGGDGFPIVGLLDSGADWSCFPEDWAPVLGISLEDCDCHGVQTGDGMGCHYEWHEPLNLVIGEIKLPVSAIFGRTGGVAVLGRRDIFEHFYVEIDEKNKFTYLTPHEVDVPSLEPGATSTPTDLA